MICDMSIQKSLTMLCIWYTTIYADLCKSAPTPHTSFSYLYFFGFIAFMPLVHIMWHMAAQNSATWRLSKDSSQRGNPETKHATPSWSELNMNFHFFEISVNQNLELKPQSILLDSFEHSLPTPAVCTRCYSELEPFVPSEEITEWPWYHIAAPSSHLLYFWPYINNICEISLVLCFFMIMLGGVALQINLL